MPIERLDAAAFQREVANAGVLAVEFALSPSGALAVTAEQLPELRCAHVDPQADPAIGAMFGLSEGPALLIFRDQIVLYFERGEHTAERTIELVRQIQALDMEAVRTAIDEEKRAETALRMRRVCPTARRKLL